MMSFPSSLLEAFATVIMMMSATTSEPSHPELPGTGQFLTREISTGQGARRYKLYIPSQYNGSSALPLVVMLHGCTQDPDDIARGTQMNDLADVKLVIVAYPEQPEAANAKKCWNWYEPAHQRRDEGEPALIAAITRRVMQDYRVDPRRVYVAGISAGAAMAVTVALSYPELYAAVGSHSGIAYGAAAGVMEALSAMQGRGAGPEVLASKAKAAMGAQAGAISAVLFQGGNDRVVNPLNAAQLSAQLIALQNGIPAGVTADQPSEKGESPGGYHYTRTVSGNGNSTIELWQVEELGHAWSGGSADGTFTDARGPSATKEMLRFFLEHPRPSKESNR